MFHGLENAPKALISMLRGETRGKALVRLEVAVPRL